MTVGLPSPVSHQVVSYDLCKSKLVPFTPEGSSKMPLGQKELEALTDVLPQTRTLDDVLDRFYYKLHDDKKLPEFSAFFAQILKDNSSVFKDLNANQKAQILFDEYRALTLAKLYETPEYKEAYCALQQTLKQFVDSPLMREFVDLQLTEKIHKNYLSAVHYLHRSFVHFAVANPLGVKPSNVELLSDYQTRNLNLSHARISNL